MRHKKIEKTILNIFRLMPLFCLLLFILYVCLTGFTKVKSYTYDNSSTEDLTEELTTFNYSLDFVVVDPVRVFFTGSTGFWINSQGLLYNASSSYFVTDFYHIDDIINVVNNGTIYVWYYDIDLNYIGNAQFSPTFSPTFNDYYYFRLGYVSNTGAITDTDLFYYWSNSYYTDDFTIVNKVNYFFNEYIFKYTDSLFNGGINAPFNAFTNVINLNSSSIFYTYFKFSYLYLLYIFLLDMLYLCYCIIVFIPKWFLREFEKRS